MGFLAAHRGFSLRVSCPVFTLFVFFAAFFHAAGVATAEPAPLGPETGKPVPDSLVYLSPQNQGYILLVEKAHQKAYLYDKQNPDGPLKVYPCSTGENKGPKQRRNDKRTPEGVYFITNSFERKDLTPVYGDRAFPLDYPNVRDRKLGRRGYGIWIHGTNEVLKPRDTNGCIVFSNEGIRDLAGYIGKRHTPVIITQEINFIEKQQLLRDRAQIKSLVDNWTHAWKGGHTDRYISFYAEDFTAQGKTRLQWRAYKKRLSANYGAVDITIDNLQILREGGIALATFDQTYRADKFCSFGEKRLYLQQRSPQWKIVDEFFKRKDRPPRPPQQDLAAIKQMIATWQQAWEKKDLTRYMACYTDDFTAGGLTRKAWEEHKQKLNKRYTNITVTVTNLTVELLSTRQARASFDQDYRSDRYHDRGTKTMHLIKQGNRWKIQGETWLQAAQRNTK